jgi:hypothetical protein
LFYRGNLFASALESVINSLVFNCPPAIGLLFDGEFCIFYQPAGDLQFVSISSGKKVVKCPKKNCARDKKCLIELKANGFNEWMNSYPHQHFFPAVVVFLALANAFTGLSNCGECQ